MTKEEVIKVIRENEAGIIYDDGSYGRVLKEDYFNNVSTEIVKLFDIPDELVCHSCKSDISEEFIPKCYCPECGVEWQTGP